MRKVLESCEKRIELSEEDGIYYIDEYIAGRRSVGYGARHDKREAGALYEMVKDSDCPRCEAKSGQFSREAKIAKLKAEIAYLERSNEHVTRRFEEIRTS